VIADTGLRQALQRLSPGDREALLLIGWEGLDHDAAATVLGCSTVTFKVRVHRARRRLTKLLAAADRDEQPAPAPLNSPAPAHRKARSA
jgi:RNA polymerase sigma-70 factor (ECF subfamily)